MNVLIVAKTHMSQAFCVGAYDIDNKRNVRLLTSSGKNQDTNTPFEVGQVWGIHYIPKSNIQTPHVEDVLVQKQEYLRSIDNLPEYLFNEVPIWKGNPTSIFGGKINFPIGRSGFLEQQNFTFRQSVGFWIADKDLELTILKDKKHYLYFGDQVFSFPYVGVANKEDKILAGTIIRVSMARKWSPNNRLKKSCYCQLSGWYDKA